MDVIILAVTTCGLIALSIVEADRFNTGPFGWIWFPLFILPTLFVCGRMTLWFERYSESLADRHR